MQTRRLIVTLVLTLASLIRVTAVADAAEPRLQYNRDIRPILAENCFACHGADSAARKADLRLDRRDDAIAAGAIVPGQPAASELVTRILLPASDSGIMPPVKSHKSLTAEQKAKLQRWIAEGADYQPHWSFIPPQRPAVPQPKQADWVRNPIDAFILFELEKRGLKPAPEADRRTLARRLSLDLTGLPPAPERVEAFVNDKSPDYYERFVDELLASPHWGEHRARYWLDAARYADTHGIHFDNYREMWSYRDWVIRAFNANQRFDQFTIEQLAGDLLPNPTLDQRIATGFNRCNITTNEGGIIDEEYVVLYARDRTETTATVWMGLTMGCAVCHDHKYDPFSMKDFYSLSAFFNNSTQPARDGNIPNTPPVIPVPRLEDRERWSLLQEELNQARGRIDARKRVAQPLFESWLTTATASHLANRLAVREPDFAMPLDEGSGKTVRVRHSNQERTVPLPAGYSWATVNNAPSGLQIQPGSAALEFPEFGDFDANQPFSVSVWLYPNQRNVNGALLARMNPKNGFRGWDIWLQQDKVGLHLIHDWTQGNGLKVVSKSPLTLRKWQQVTVSYNGSGKAAGVQIRIDGQAVPVEVEADQLQGSIRTEVPFKIGQRDSTDRIQGIFLRDLRIHQSAVSALQIEQMTAHERIQQLLAQPPEKRSQKDREELFHNWLLIEDAEYQELLLAYRALEQEETAIKSRGTIAHVWNEKPGEAMAFILHRGEYDKRRDPVKADTPAALPPLPSDFPRNRLGLARWLLRDEHPLTARVTVNRFWQELFGVGLVRTSEDFGTTGELPSHPELLDWLAVEFRSDWDVKRFFKLLVSSATYRQSAVATREKLELDPHNRLLSRGPRFRMDAEMIRDYALAVSGLLVPKIGGPSVKPYQPDGVWEAVAMIGSNTRHYQRDSGDNLYRRSLYTFWKRSAPPAFLDVLNAPNRETCTVRRDRTNTPLQALLTLNDVQYVEAARVLAEKAVKASAEPGQRAQFLAQRVLCRPFVAEELAIVQTLVSQLREKYLAAPTEAKRLISFGESKPDPAVDPIDLAVWTMVANQLLNMDEVLNK